MTPTCVVCGKPFARNGRNRAVTCGPGCSTEHRRRRDVERKKRERDAREPTLYPCRNCSKPFRPAQSSQRYCSRACKKQAPTSLHGATFDRRQRERLSAHNRAMRELLVSRWGRRA